MIYLHWFYIFFIFFWNFWKKIFLKFLKFFFWKFWIFEKNYSLKPSLAYLLSYCIFSFLKFLAVWEEIGDKKPAPIPSPPHHFLLESNTCRMRPPGYEYQDNENELHLRVGLSLRSRQWSHCFTLRIDIRVVSGCIYDTRITD